MNFTISLPTSTEAVALLTLWVLMHPILAGLCAVVLVAWFASSCWAWQQVRALGDNPFWWKVFLVVCPAFTWVISKIGAVQ